MRFICQISDNVVVQSFRFSPGWFISMPTVVLFSSWEQTHRESDEGVTANKTSDRKKPTWQWCHDVRVHSTKLVLSTLNQAQDSDSKPHLHKNSRSFHQLNTRKTTKSPTLLCNLHRPKNSVDPRRIKDQIFVHTLSFCFKNNLVEQKGDRVVMLNWTDWDEWICSGNFVVCHPCVVLS